MHGDFKEFFDPRKLDEQTRGSLEFVLNSPAYPEYFKPFIEDILHKMNNLWKDRSRDRQEVYPDDYLAGGAIFGECMLNFFETIIRETNMERIHAAMENMTNDMLYELKRQRGQVKPVVGLDQHAEPQQVDPADDF